MKDFLRYAISVVCAFVLAFALVGCAPVILGGVAAGGALTLAGTAKWLSQQSWMPAICYWVGDEAALTAMPTAPRNADADLIAFCDEGLAYLDKANGLPADVVNATLASQLAKLPAAQVVWVQGAAVILDDFLPPSVTGVALTGDQINCIEGLLKGIRDGTQSCMDKLPPEIAKALAKAASKKADIRVKHPAGLKAATPGGWFVVPPVQVVK
jgi:hypothetical protein